MWHKLKSLLLYEPHNIYSLFDPSIFPSLPPQNSFTASQVDVSHSVCCPWSHSLTHLLLISLLLSNPSPRVLLHWGKRAASGGDEAKQSREQGVKTQLGVKQNVYNCSEGREEKLMRHNVHIRAAIR